MKLGQVVGRIELIKDGKTLAIYNLVASEDVEKRNIFDIFKMLLRLEM